MEVDLMEMVSQQLPVLRDIALKEGKLEDAIESLLGLEKQARLAADLQATTAICLGIVDICKDAGNWRALAENVSLICKRRGQLKEAIVKTIQKCMEFVPLLPSKEEKLEYIEALRVVTAGRIHVELESARLTRILSTIREEEGKVAEAADILQEIQVETYGSMDKKEKLDFLLEQVRLCMDKGDFIRAAIINRKISTKAFDGVEFQDEKIRYYNQVVRYRLHEKDYLGVSKCYHAILHTPSVEAVEEKWIEALKYCVLFLALSSFGEESSDFIHRLLTTEKRLEELTSFRLLLKELSSSELVDWMGTEGKVTDMMALLPLFKQGLESYVSVLKTRILEHNIRVFSECYKALSLQRMAGLLGVDAQEAESAVSAMVIDGMIVAKIDRSGGQITFGKTKTAESVLDEWSGDIDQLLKLVDSTCYLINKENVMMSAVKAK